MTYFIYNGALNATNGQVRNIDGITFITKEEYEAKLAEMNVIEAKQEEE